MENSELPPNVRCDFTGKFCQARMAGYAYGLDIGETPDKALERVEGHRAAERAMGHFGCFGATNDGLCGVDYVTIESLRLEDVEGSIEATKEEREWIRLKRLAPEHGGHNWYPDPVQKPRTLLR